MSISANGNVDREELAERAPIVGGILVVAAVLAVGAASFVGGANAGFGDRLPVYVFAGAVAFIGALLWMRDSLQDGMSVLRGATAVGCFGFVGTCLGAEAAVYALVVVPSLSLYLASVLTIACGLIYWSIRNWRAVNDLTRPW